MRGKKMVFKMPQIGRTVELDDAIVSEYVKTVEPSIVTESPFILALKQDFGHYPNEDEMSFDELSKYCDNVLLQELQFSASLPKLTQFLASGGEDALRNASSQQKAVKCVI
jgi:hypothetical protein